MSVASHRASNNTDAGMKCRNTLSIMAARPSDVAEVKNADLVVKKADPAEHR
jgi:hypothetical protein